MSLLAELAVASPIHAAGDESAGGLLLLFKHCEGLSTPLIAIEKLPLLTSQSQADERCTIHDKL